MAVASGAALLPNPRSAAQMRAFAAAVKRITGASDAEIADILAEIAILEAQADPISATFDETMGVGTPVRVLSTGNVEKAQANSTTNANVGGLVFTAANGGATGAYVPNGGRVTQGDWTAVIGAAALTAGSQYFLSATEGLLTTTAPSSSGNVVIKAGRALTAALFQVEIGVPVLLV